MGGRGGGRLKRAGDKKRISQGEKLVWFQEHIMQDTDKTVYNTVEACQIIQDYIDRNQAELAELSELDRVRLWRLCRRRRRRHLPPSAAVSLSPLPFRPEHH